MQTFILLLLRKLFFRPFSSFLMRIKILKHVFPKILSAVILH